MSDTATTLTPDELRAVRERWGLTQEQMAARIGMRDHRHVSRMERGVRPISTTVALLVRCLDSRG